MKTISRGYSILIQLLLTELKLLDSDYIYTLVFAKLTLHRGQWHVN